MHDARTFILRFTAPLLFLPVVLLLVCGTVVHGQTPARKPRSLALKDPSAARGLIRLPPDNSAEEMWDEFLLVQRANSGDPVAEHQLGLRYLLGKGFFADTVRAAEWVGRAARQNLITAKYNYGIFQNNGWGVRWSPFDALHSIRDAAYGGLTDAKFVYGIFFLEDLALTRNVDSAYRWIRAAADSGFAPALGALAEMKSRGIHPSGADSAADVPSGGQSSSSTVGAAFQPVFLDLGRDSLPPVSDSALVREAIARTSAARGSPNDTDDDSRADTVLTAETVARLREAATAGSPEALTVLGRLAESGRFGGRDTIAAAACYLRAARFDSPRAPALLWELVRNEKFFADLKARVDRHDPEAQFVWSGLFDLGFDARITEAQAFSFLVDAARQNYPDALVQLALCTYAGKWTRKDPAKAMELFEQARALGNREAGIRICLATLRSSVHGEGPEPCVARLREEMEAGSLLAAATLGYCFERGLGVRIDTARSVAMYRVAAERGSKLAYAELKGLYDTLRPPEEENASVPHPSRKRKARR